MQTVYVCEDSLEGILSGVYKAWSKRHNTPRDRLLIGGIQNMELFCEYEQVEVNEAHAAAVLHMLRKNFSAETYEQMLYGLFSHEPDRADAFLGTLIAALQQHNSRRIMDAMGIPEVRKLVLLSRAAFNEAHHYTGFLRFRELKNGILYSQIEPKNHVLFFLAEHFADRFPMENWLIRDLNRNLFAVHEAGKNWVLTSWKGDAELFYEISQSERELESLWKGFCKSISIEGRENRNLQKQNMPLRFQSQMLEFQV